MSAHTVTLSSGEEYVQATYQLPGCGCAIYGGGSLQQPLRIRHCPLHAAAPDLLKACTAAVETLTAARDAERYVYADDITDELDEAIRKATV